VKFKKWLLQLAIKLYIPAAIKGMRHTMGRVFQKKATLSYPEEVHVPRKGYRGEHRLKKDEVGRMKCVACLMCQTACPAECIQIVGAPSPWPDREKIPVVFNIDMLKCIYCGMCEEACPFYEGLDDPGREDLRHQQAAQPVRTGTGIRIRMRMRPPDAREQG
jgi:formate hydrogenlyase subunit 6/NADH:ubiquinone oxidoreductase subunit I